LKNAVRSRAAPWLQGDTFGELKLSPMVPMSKVDSTDLTYRIDGPIPAKAIDLRARADKLIVSGIIVWHP
jgi:hypothetical protein